MTSSTTSTTSTTVFVTLINNVLLLCVRPTFLYMSYVYICI